MKTVKQVSEISASKEPVTIMNFMVAMAEKESRHNYCPAVGCDNKDGVWTAWLKLNDEGDDVYLKRLENGQWAEEIKVSSKPEMIYRPCMAAHPEDGVWVFWAENASGSWKICGRHYDTGGNLRNKWNHAEEGRPCNLACHLDCNNNIHLAWESHFPGRTVIKIAELANGKLSVPRTLSDPGFNSYDPSMASDSKGLLWVAYTSFQRGNYDIFCRSFDYEDNFTGKEIKVSWLNGYNYYPAVTVDSQDRAWFSFVSYRGEHWLGEQPPLVKTELRKRQHSFWLNKRYIHCACLDRGKWFIPVKYDAAQPFRCTGIVPAPENAGYPRIAFDTEGKLWLFYRYFDTKINYRSQISAVYHKGDSWSSPLIDEGGKDSLGDAESISLTRDNAGKFWYVRQADYRTNWEYFDKETGEGILLDSLNPVKAEGIPPQLYPLIRNYTPDSSSSNPDVNILTARREKTYRLVFGNIHRHSEISGCYRDYNGSLDLHYRQARDVMGEDFSAITDHGSNGDDLNWHKNLKALAVYYYPGSFVVIPSVEWTASGKSHTKSLGHYNVHYFGEDREAVPYTAKHSGYSDTPDKLWRLLGNKNVLTVVHHSADWDHYHQWDYCHPRFEPLVEIFQDLRGSAEYRSCPGTIGFRQTPGNGCFVQDALKRGYKLGFIGGGDHFGLALAGVYVESLSREGLFEALRKRRCFASTGIKLHMDFRLNGAFMGEILKLSKGEKRTLYIRITAPEIVRSVTIVRNNEDIYTHRGESGEEKFEYHDTEPLERLLQPREEGEPSIYYYLRVILRNGEMAWASPIWIF